jgi:enamine deaminase RidA (YjgF/YER057c/UK114 family)
MAIERSNPPGTAYTGMSQAVRAGGWIHISGQVALQGSTVVGSGDAQRQAEQCFANIRAALQEAGASLHDVVKLTCYLTDKTAYAGYAAARNQLFADHPPASTVVVVKELLMPELLMEVEAIAWAG